MLHSLCIYTDLSQQLGNGNQNIKLRKENILLICHFIIQSKGENITTVMRDGFA